MFASGALGVVSLHVSKYKNELINLRDVQVHRLIAFAAGCMLNESGPASFDLDTAAGFLLDMLDI